ELERARVEIDRSTIGAGLSSGFVQLVANGDELPVDRETAVVEVDVAASQAGLPRAFFGLFFCSSSSWFGPSPNWSGCRVDRSCGRAGSCRSRLHPRWIPRRAPTWSTTG